MSIYQLNSPRSGFATYIIQQHQLVALATRISRDAGELGDQVGHDHE